MPNTTQEKTELAEKPEGLKFGLEQSQKGKVMVNKKQALVFLCMTLGLGTIKTFAATKVDPCARNNNEILQGEFLTVQEDDFQENSKERAPTFHLRTANNCVYNIHPKTKIQTERLSKLKSGSKVRIKGTTRNHEFDLNSKNDLKDSGIQVTSEPLSEAQVGAPYTEAASVLVILVNFSGTALTCTRDDVKNVMFDSPSSVNNFYRAATYGSVSVSPVTVGPFTIPDDGTNCSNVFLWGQLANKAAWEAGVNVGQYRHVIYAIPPVSACGWAGKGSIGGIPSQAWVAKCGANYVYAHELGHNFGMHHAATPALAYGDFSDVMGCCTINEFNAPHKYAQGWIPSNNIIEAPQPGVYTLSAVDLNPASAAHPQIIRISKPDTNNSYYLSYRTNTDWLSFLDNRFLNGINIHTYSAGPVMTYYQETMSDGQTYSDPINALYITQLSHDASSATIKISGACTSQPPVIALGPTIPSFGSGDVYQKSGMQTDYQVSVSNQDSNGCSDSGFDIKCSNSLGLNTSDSWMLASGQSGSKTFAVGSTLKTPSNKYPVTCTITRTATGASSSVAANYFVDDIVPSLPRGSWTSPGQGQIALSWTVSTDANPGVSYLIFRDRQQIAQTPSTSYQDTVAAGSRHFYQIRAIDAAGNLSLLPNSIGGFYATAK